MKKIKVVWLCHFTNQEMKSYFNAPHVNEFAPWISYLIELFNKIPSVDLHIVAPNYFNNKNVTFVKDDVTYHFFQYLPIPLYNKYLKIIYSVLQIDLITNYNWLNYKIPQLIKKINPDIIHLHGAENSQSYSSGILSLINKYPVITTIQGFIGLSRSVNNLTNKRKKIENEIISNCVHFGVRTEDMKNVIFNINPKAVFHYHNYPISVPKIVKSNIGYTEPIDCVFFARISKDKGIEDLLKAVSIISKNIPSISLSVIGGANSLYMNYLKKMCLDLAITRNVKFLGFVQTQRELHEYVLNAKICVLPTYYDIIPGTIIESMFVKLPVVAYAVGGIPELNQELETVAIVEKGNIKELVQKITLLLTDVGLRKELAENAFAYSHKRFDNNKVAFDIIDAYRIVMSDFENL